jgi:hypothetical protein
MFFLIYLFVANTISHYTVKQMSSYQMTTQPLHGTAFLYKLRNTIYHTWYGMLFLHIYS